MRAAVVTGPGRLELRVLPVPEPGPGEVRIRSAWCGICATDLAMLAGSARARYPLVLGHEWSGVVDAVGPGVEGSLVGSRCVAENVLGPGCEVGFERPGAYAELFLTQARLLRPVPAALSLRVAALAEPLAVCVRGLRRLRVVDPSSALVFGDGVIGLLALLLLVSRGVSDVTMAGGRPGRLAVARSLGARRVANHHEAADGSAEALAAELHRQGTPASGYANVVEASGSASALGAAFAVAAPEAHILLLGDYEGVSAAVPWQRWLHREYEVMTSNASAGAWPEAVRLAGELSASLSPLVTHTVAVDGIERGMELMRRGDGGAIRVLVDWGLER